MITSENIKCKTTINVCINAFYFNIKVWLLLIVNTNKTPLLFAYWLPRHPVF